MTAETTATGSRLFICYRPEDSDPRVHALFSTLCDRFSPDRVFKDIVHDENKSDIVDNTQREFESCSVVLVVIGEHWLTIQDPVLKLPRLRNADDQVRLELVTALETERIHLIPVLVAGARLPTADDLPSDLARLSEIPAVELSDKRWGPDLDALMSAIDRTLGSAGTAAPERQEQPRYLDDNVQFTVYRPKMVRPREWYQLLAFAHLSERRADSPDDPDPLQAVQDLAQSLLGHEADEFQTVVQDSPLSIPRSGELTFIPTVEGVDFNPRQRSFRWEDSVHWEQFRLRASGAMDGKLATGRLVVLLGGILLAEIVLRIRVDSRSPEARPSQRLEADSARPYRRIFASYSHQDLTIVEQFEHYARAFGDEYLRDSLQLRCGESWSDRLQQMISQADVFQLFWSSRSLRSPFVRQEWEYALALGRPNFVRPTYWEDPLPSSPELGLPPPELLKLHFQRISFNEPKPSGAPKTASALPTSVPGPTTVAAVAMASARASSGAGAAAVRTSKLPPPTRWMARPPRFAVASASVLAVALVSWSVVDRIGTAPPSDSIQLPADPVDQPPPAAASPPDNRQPETTHFQKPPTPPAASASTSSPSDASDRRRQATERRLRLIREAEDEKRRAEADARAREIARLRERLANETNSRMAAPARPEASAAPSASPSSTEEERVRAALHEYERAMEGLDQMAIRQIYPSITANQLSQTLADVRAYNLTFEILGMEISVDRQSTLVTCRVFRQMIDKRGQRKEQTRQEVFTLQKHLDAWVIVQIR